MSTPALVESAVLAPVYRDGGGALHLIFVLRGPGGRHGNQLAFPGGRAEPGDTSALDTALREAEEEIGLSRQAVRVLASLPVVETAATGFRIAPFLGRLDGPPPAWRRQEEEIAAVLDVLVDDLLRPEALGEEEWQLETWAAPRRVPFYWIGEHRLWGATQRIVEPLLPRLVAGEWAI